jgi:hypothetical protein
MTFAEILVAIAKYGPIVIASAAGSAAMLPKPSRGTWYAVLRGVIDLLAANFGNAKNAP